MLGNFDRCFAWLMEHEGGFVNHPSDPGGMTNWGVTKATYERFTWRDVTEAEMRSLTQDDVRPIYRQMYWDKVRGDDLPAGVDWCVFDFAVNAGISRAIKMLQTASGSAADGIIGPNTLLAVERNDPEALISSYSTMRQAYYESLTDLFKTFGRGWTRRVDETREQAMHLAQR